MRPLSGGGERFARGSTCCRCDATWRGPGTTGPEHRWRATSAGATSPERRHRSTNAVSLPEIKVIGTTPLAPSRPVARPAAAAATAAPTAVPETAPKPVPGAVEQDKIPSNVQTVGASAFDYAKAPDLLQAMVQALPGVALSSQTGNEFQLDFNYRGYVAGPVIGTPQGLAVYQNGVRINEVFGDVVNWDLIPQSAINRLTLVPSNPVYGLNAIGGALAFEMKNGYTYHAVEGEVNGGSYGRAVASVQAGGEVGNLSGYITADAIDDAGWRMISPSSLRRVFADLGARGDQTEFHVSFTGANNFFSGTRRHSRANAQAELVEHIHAAANDAKSTRFPDGKCDLEAERHVDLSGNCLFSQLSPDARRRQPNNARTSGCPDPTVLCFPNLDGTVSNLTTTRGQTIPASGPLGQVSWPRSTAPGQRPTVSAAQCRRHRRKSCLVTGTISRSG